MLAILPFALLTLLAGCRLKKQTEDKAITPLPKLVVEVVKIENNVFTKDEKEKVLTFKGKAPDSMRELKHGELKVKFSVNGKSVTPQFTTKETLPLSLPLRESVTLHCSVPKEEGK